MKSRIIFTVITTVIFSSAFLFFISPVYGSLPDPRLDDMYFDHLTTESKINFIEFQHEIPSWIKNNVKWWVDEQIDDSTFIQGMQFLIEKGFLKIHSQDIIDDTKPSFLFKVYIDGEHKKLDGTYMRYIFELKPEGTELYNEYRSEIKKQAVVFPTFTLSAYSPSGFYDYYNGNCEESCLTTTIRNDFHGDYKSSDSSWQILTRLGYTGITDVDIDKNPEILEDYDKVILLHSEYVTRTEFDAITSHSNVIYLYPNALYAEVETNYDENTISLIRGHGYPEGIDNGFGWEFDNTRPYEYDADCLTWKFYSIKNGLMLNCYPEDRIWHDPFLLKAINESKNSFWWTISSKYDDLPNGLSSEDKQIILPIYEKYLKMTNQN